MFQKNVVNRFLRGLSSTISRRVSLDFRPKLSSPNNGYMLRSMFTVLILGGRGKIHKLTYLPHMHDSLPFQS